MSQQDGSAETEETEGAEGTEEGHGVSGTTRGDSRMEEEPASAGETEEAEDWASETETGGEASS